jgi:hypothetical protein
MTTYIVGRLRYHPLALICSLVAILLVTAQPPSLWAAPITEVVVKSGDVTQDGDGKFDVVNAFTLPALNNCGSAAFVGRLNRTVNADPGLPQPYFGSFLGNASNLSQVARITDPAPGGAPTDTFQTFGSTPAFPLNGPAVNDSGQLFFISRVTTSSFSNCLFRSRALSRLLNWGQAAPDNSGNGVYLANPSQAPAFNQKGVGAFVASLRNSSLVLVGSAIYRTSNGKLTQIVRQGQALPGGSTFGPTQAGVASIHPILNESGQVAFVNSTSGGAFEGVYRGDGKNPITKIARLGDGALPGGGSIGAFDAGSAPDMNDAGEVVFVVDLSGTGWDAMFKGSGGALTPIARRGDPIPNSSDTFLDFEGLARINKSGQVAFIADVDGGNSSYYAIFRSNGNVTKTIVHEGQSTPNRAGIFSSLHLNTFCLNDSGQIAFTAGLDVDLSNITPVEEHGIYFFDGTNILQIARTNDTFMWPDGKSGKITDLKLAGTVSSKYGGVAPAERSGLNEAGQVAFDLTTTFSDNTQREGIAIWSPTLKLLCAHSTKTHGANKTFDIELPAITSWC